MEFRTACRSPVFSLQRYTHSLEHTHTHEKEKEKIKMREVRKEEVRGGAKKQSPIPSFLKMQAKVPAGFPLKHIV